MSTEGGNFESKRKKHTKGTGRQKKILRKGLGQIKGRGSGRGKGLGRGSGIRRSKVGTKKNEVNESKSKVNEKKIKRNSKVAKRKSTNVEPEDQGWVELGKAPPKKTAKRKTRTNTPTPTKTQTPTKTRVKLKTPPRNKKSTLLSRTISKTPTPKKIATKKNNSYIKPKSQPNSPVVKSKKRIKKVTRFSSGTKLKKKPTSPQKPAKTKKITTTKKLKTQVLKKKTLTKKTTPKTKSSTNSKKTKKKAITNSREKQPSKLTSLEAQINKLNSEETEENLELGLLTSSESDEENPEDYKKGGYHPTKVGEIFKKRYKALFKIGWGYFSTVWLVEDIKYGGKMVRTKAGRIIKKEKCLALKIVKSSKIFAQVAIDEIKILMKSSSNYTNRICPVVRLHDHFLHQGPNGKHICMVFEFLDQKNLLSLIRQYGVDGLPIPIVKEITRQILRGLDHLHSKCKIIHTDIKPENIMLYSKIGNIPSRLKEKMEHVQRRTELKKKLNLQGKKINKNKSTNNNTNKSNSKQNSEEHSESESGSEDFMDITKTGGQMSQQFKHRQSKMRLIKTLNKEENNPVGSKKKNKNKMEKSGSGLSLTQNEQDLLFKQFSDKEDDDENNNKEEEEEKRKKREQFLKRVTPNRIKCKIVDLGNACWFDKHFSSEIQTREYRSPEVILGHDYDWTADIWSMGCMIFELLTGEVLFTPSKGDGYSKDEDHLALIMEMFGKIPKKILLTGANSSKVVDSKDGNLKSIKNLHFWPLEKVLHEKHNFNKKQSQEIADFLNPMFEYNLKKRASARQLLKHPWLKVFKKN
ncbi:hypothetical protein M0812_11908 [Anaeramoeba flamelloides]|uniref:non-specific serine/threonine protein kinase n=1 Tax=Anaeramoeba flamelloides TaxID=1746091 RepID=A0AAV7ZJH1_9EUKA|nr:hypothetical protein M0812_11908 [Anaeramoeba flamelloides]